MNVTTPVATWAKSPKPCTAETNTAIAPVAPTVFAKRISVYRPITPRISKSPVIRIATSVITSAQAAPSAPFCQRSWN